MLYNLVISISFYYTAKRVNPMCTYIPSFLDLPPFRSPQGTEYSCVVPRDIQQVLISCLFYTQDQFSSVSQSCLTLRDPMNHSTPGLPVHHQLPESTQIHVHWAVMPSNHLFLCHPLLLLPSIFPRIRVFSNESVLRIRWPKYWSFSFNISLSNEHPGLISFRMDWLDLLTVQGTLKNLLQHHSSKAPILRC